MKHKGNKQGNTSAHNDERIMGYGDMNWEKLYLSHERFYSIRDMRHKRKEGILSANTTDVFCETDENVTLCPGRRTTKITDCGYDMLSCCYTRIPVECDFDFSASVRVERFLADGHPVFQEGFGLFIRDNMLQEPSTGYPYSNMALVGGYLGDSNFYIRSGVTETDREEISNFSLKKRPEQKQLSISGDSCVFRIRLSLSGQQINAEMLDENGNDVLGSGETPEDGAGLSTLFSRSGSVYSFPAEKNLFLQRDKKNICIGFLAAGDTRITIEKDSVSVRLTPQSIHNREEIYVSAGGRASASGRKDDPMDLAAAIAKAGNNTIHMLPGRYFPKEDLVLGSRRLPGDCIISGEPGRRADTIIDFAGRDHGLKITGNNWHLEEITVTGGMGIQISGSHNYLKKCAAVRNRETGILIRHPDNHALRRDWPSFNRIEGCVSCMNMDESERNSDGFAAKVTAGRGNEFIRCISFLNSDDGFDLFAKNRPTGRVRLAACTSCLNGFRYSAEDGLVQTKGHGTGFKLGGSGIRVRHLLSDCTAAVNKDIGFTSNSNPSMFLINCRAVNNQKGDEKFFFSGTRVIPEKVLIGFSSVEDPDLDPEALFTKLLTDYDIDPEKL